MLKARLIVCLDIDKGRVVKGVRFKELKDAGCPILASKTYSNAGADELCFLDITATYEKRDILLDMVREVASVCFIPLTVGGGVRSVGDAKSLFLAGADKVSFNSQAIKNPPIIEECAKIFGSQSIVVALDVKKVGEDRWEIFTQGGRQATGLDALSFARKITTLGAGEILLTSMDKDGTKTGFDLDITRLVADHVSVPVIASGGVGTLAHLSQGIIKGHASAVLAASIFHYGSHTIQEAKAHMAKDHIPVRMLDHRQLSD